MVGFMRRVWEKRKWTSWKKAGCFLVLTLGVFSFVSGCGKGAETKQERVKLSIWAEESNHALLEKKIKEFQKEYKDEAKIDVTISTESEETCRTAVLENQKGAADLFIFADDQFGDLYRGNALLEITDQPEEIRLLRKLPCGTESCMRFRSHQETGIICIMINPILLRRM